MDPLRSIMLSVNKHFINFTMKMAFDFHGSGWPESGNERLSQTWELQPSAEHMETDKFLNQEAYWDSSAEKKEFTTPFQMELFKKFVAKDARILDVGCGYGRTLNELYLSGFTHLFGIDFSKKMIERGETLYPHLNFQQSESGIIPFKDNTFDAVILLAVLTCIVSDHEQEKLIKEIQRVLRNGAIVYINDFLLNSDRRNRERYDKYESTYHNYGTFQLPEGALLRHHTRQRIYELTDIFSDIIFEPVNYKTMNGNRSNGFYYMGVNNS